MRRSRASSDGDCRCCSLLRRRRTTSRCCVCSKVARSSRCARWPSGCWSESVGERCRRRLMMSRQRSHRLGNPWWAVKFYSWVGRPMARAACSKKEAWYGALSLITRMRRDARGCAWVLVESVAGYGLCDGVDVSCDRRWRW